MYSFAFRTLLRFLFNKRLQQKVLITIQRRHTGVIPQDRTCMHTCMYTFTDHQLLQQYWWISLSKGICVIVCVCVWNHVYVWKHCLCVKMTRVQGCFGKDVLPHWNTWPRGNRKTTKSVLHLISVRKRQNSDWDVNEITISYDHVVVWQKQYCIITMRYYIG